MEVIYRLFIANKVEYNSIIMETLLNNIDLSRLNVTALDSNKNNIEKTNISFKDSNLLIYLLLYIIVIIKDIYPIVIITITN